MRQQHNKYEVRRKQEIQIGLSLFAVVGVFHQQLVGCLFLVHVLDFFFVCSFKKLLVESINLRHALVPLAEELYFKLLGK